MAYAESTSVPTGRSRDEIERLVTQRYGGDNFASLVSKSTNTATVVFDLNGRRIRFTVPLPDRQSEEITHRIDGRSRSQKPRTEAQADALWEQLSRSRWRALLLMVKAMLESVEVGIVSFEDAFLPYTMLPNGTTVAEAIGGQVGEAYVLNTMPVLQIGQGR